MNLWAISDLHLNRDINRDALREMPAYRDDWLILAGDIGDSPRHLEYALDLLVGRFRRIVWVPGNHDLWTMPEGECQLRGTARYEHLVEMCRAYDVLTPEDDYAVFENRNQRWRIAPLFTLYDYSFRPDDVEEDRVLQWAAEENIQCADERLLFPDPYPSRSAWCAARCKWTERQLAKHSGELPMLFVNHYPMQQQLAVLPRIPRFTPWCGTRQTEDWAVRFRAEVVVFGHLHIRQARMIDNVQHVEVSLGYPSQWNQEHGIANYLRRILPFGQ